MTATVDQIITFAMKDAGLLQEGDVPTAAEYAEGITRLNDLITFWQTRGIKLWTWLDQSVTLVAGQATYTFLPGGSVSMTKPMKVISAYFLDANGNKTPLNPLSWDEYTRLSQTTQQGALNSYFVNKLQLQISVSFWLVPDATAALGTAHVVLQTQIANFTTVADLVGFPPEWFLALRWGLADDWCTGQPQKIMDRCATKAALYLTSLEDWDVEDTSTTFTPDGRSSRGSFR